MTTNRNKRLSMDTRTKRQHAVVSKFITDRMSPKQYDKEGNRRAKSPPMDMMNAVAQRTGRVINDLDSLEQLLPDISLAAQILVSSILSPKDMGTPELIYEVNSKFKNSELGQAMLKVVSNYFTDDYKINAKLSPMLHDILITKGSYAQMIVPESSLDEIINDRGRLTLESNSKGRDLDAKSAFNKLISPIGILGSSNQSSRDDVSFESLFSSQPSTSGLTTIGNCKYLIVNDNPDMIKLPKLYEKIRKDRVNQALGHRYASLEKRKSTIDDKVKSKKSKVISVGSKDRDIELKLDQQRDHAAEQIVTLKTKDQTDREMIGHPMVMHLPSESVIPAHVPSDPENHIAYLIILDQYGNPINTTTAIDHYNDLQQAMQQSKSENSISNILKEMQGGQDTTGAMTHTETIAQATDAFADIIERDMLARIRNGLGHDSVEFENSSEIYQIMLSRVLKKKHTQILYVPAELMSYMAFYYTRHGIGESLLEKSRVLAGIRVLLMFANTMAAIRNSTSRTELDIQLDERDTDPLSTIDQIREAFMRSRSDQFPIGEGNPNSIVHYLNAAGVDVVYSGHPDLPDMKVSSNDVSPSKTTIDSELEENYRKQHIMSLGLSPEMVDTSTEVNFATTLVNSSILLTKRVYTYQTIYEEHLADFIRKYTDNSETLITQLIDVINKKGAREDKEDIKKTIELFIQSIDVMLPKPDSVTLEAQMESYSKYVSSLEEAINAWISDEFKDISAEGEDAMEYIEGLRGALIAHFKRKYMRENNMFDELDEMLAKDEDGKPMFKFGEMHSEHVESILGFVEDYLEKAKEAALKRKQREEKLQEKLDRKFGDQEEEEESADETDDESEGFDDVSEEETAEEEVDTDDSEEEVDSDVDDPDEGESTDDDDGLPDELSDE